VYLFRFYLDVEDKEFKRYMQGKKEKYDEGDPDINAQNLMSLALTKYNQLVQAKTWKAKSPEEEKLIAITAQLAEGGKIFGLMHYAWLTMFTCMLH
jgi:hypothetical protein